MKYEWDPPRRVLPHKVDPWVYCPSCEGQEGKECPICLGTGGWYTSDGAPGDFEAFRRKTVRRVARAILEGDESAIRCPSCGHVFDRSIGEGTSCPCACHSTTEPEGKP